MVLDAEDGTLFMHQSLHRPVVQIEVGETEVRSPRYLPLFSGNDGESMVLRRDFDRVPIQVANRVISAVMAKREFVGLSAEGTSDQLVAQADPENRNTAL